MMKSLEIGPLERPIGADVTVDIIKRPSVDVVADIHSLPFKTGTFSYVFASHVLEHSPKWIDVMLEFSRVTNIGGIVHLAMPGIGFPAWRGIEHYRAFTLYSFKNLPDWIPFRLKYEWGKISWLTPGRGRTRDIANKIVCPVINSGQTFFERFLWWIFGGFSQIDVKLRRVR